MLADADAGFMKSSAIPGRMLLRRRSNLLVALALSAVVIAALFAVAKLSSPPSSTFNEPPPVDLPADAPECPRSVGLCIERTVTRVLDGDTLDVEGGLRIRLVDAPELSETGGPEARDYLTDLCLGSLALLDEDDFQIGDDPYGRVLAVASCGGTNANAVMISTGRAETYYEFCSDSEFGGQSWTGCSSPPPPPPPPPPGNCDSAYPDVCIPPPPPDLDCGEISFRNFRVLAPDPHRFDGDGDGFGCET
jgi:micrococcal nuclease